MTRAWLWSVLVAAAQLLTAPVLQACASCSTNGDESLVLYPNETWKLYVGATRRADFTYIKPNGVQGYARSPDTQDIFTLAAGRALGSRAFVTVAVPLLRNARGGEVAWGSGDVSVGGRFTVVTQTFMEPWLPQVQLIAGYRGAFGRSEWGALRPDALDAVGSGFNEVRTGVDVWFGMHPVQFGVAVLGGVSLPQRADGEALRPGPLVRALTSAGYYLEGWGRATVSAAFEVQGDLVRGSTTQLQSGKRAASLGAAVEAQVTPVDTLRLSGGRLMGLWSRNTLVVSSLSVAYLRAW